MLRLLLVLVLGSGLPQDVCAASPQISVNDVITDQSELTVPSGSTLSVRCHGDGPLLLKSSSFRLMHDALGDRVSIGRATVRHTGTYTCSGSANQSAELPTPAASLHLYVSDPEASFVIPKSPSTAEEGWDFLLRCMPTDPDITNISIQSAERGQGLPHGMTFTFDPWRGALLHQVQRSFEGSYVCRGRRHGQEVTSLPIHLWVTHKLMDPPSLSVSQNAAIRLVGERFEVTCFCQNKNHFFNLTWTRPPGQVSPSSEVQSQSASVSGVLKNQTLVLNSVRTQDSGLYTCTGGNTAGFTTATIRLEVRERPFVTVFLWVQNISSLIVNVTHGNSSENDVVRGGASLERGVAMEEVGGVTGVAVAERQDLRLTVLIEAYPPIRTQRWITPDHMTNGSVSRSELWIGRVDRFDSGLYSLLFENDFFKGNVSVLLTVHYPPVVQILRQDSGLVCRASAVPRPSIRWSSCPGLTDRCDNGLVIEEDSDPDLDSDLDSELDSKLDLELDLDMEGPEDLIEDREEESVERPLMLRLSPGDDITVVCSAVNHMGESHDMLSLREPASLLHPLLIGSFSVGLVLLLLLLVALWKWRQKPRFEIRWKIIDAFDGNFYTFVDPTQLPYDQSWEFPRDRLRLGAVLGSGAFGKVVAATAVGLDPDHEETTVAVKMLKPRALSEERDALMSELKILSHIGFHQNIVNLLGACTSGGPMLMITEYCCHGDLLHFLRSRAHHFLCDPEALYKNNPTNERPRSDSGISCGSDCHKMRPVGPGPGLRPRPGPGHRPRPDVPSLLDLLRFSLDVAQGLDFLSSKNCIHRDVAARNVLLTEHCVAKICDFGLARDIRNDDNYVVKGNARLPVKWMSPESIFLCVYTTQSDVWSYGVLLWEIYSMGRSPYPNMAVDSNFYRRIKDGVHMERPDFAPPELYELMTRCWDLEPTHRPTFKAIGQIISRLLPPTDDTPSSSEQVSYKNVSEREVHTGDKTDQTGSEVQQETPVRNIYQLQS
ncbi:unnamed protein product [Knipowitschia caucasica]